MFPDGRQSTADLRSHATDTKRDIDSKHKWDPKWASAGNMPNAKFGPNNTIRPARRCSRRFADKERRENEKTMKRNQSERKKSVLSTEDSTSDDETSSRASRTPELECDVKPDRGTEVLGMALTKAVKKHDHQTLLKLVKDEYDVLDNVSEDGDMEADRVIFDEGFELL